MQISLATSTDLAKSATDALKAATPQASGTTTRLRDVSIWEITTWILPMAPEHLHRVLAQTHDLPQGRAGTEGGTRWFTPAEVARLRQHFVAVAARRLGGRSKAYAPQRPAGARAPLISLCAPQGGAGRSTTLLHLACAAALGGYRVLVLDADPAGQLATALGADPDQHGPEGHRPGVLPLIARSCGLHLRQINASRMDRGEAPLAMDEGMAAALETEAAALIRPTAWPGLDIIAAAPSLLLADQQISAWRSALRSWQPAAALATALDREGLRDRYDLILCDTGRGLGPLVLGVLTSSDMLLIPQGADPLSAQLAQGLLALATAVQHEEAEARLTARALGQTAPAFGWRQIGTLPQPLPHVPQVASGQTPHLYALDYRDVGRLTYAPLRTACDAAWQGLSRVVAGFWTEDAATAGGNSVSSLIK